MFRRPWFVFFSGCPEVRLGSILRPWSRLGIAPRDSGRFDSECPDVGAGSFLFELDLEAFYASGGFVSVLGVGVFFSLSVIIRLFVHPLSWLSCRTRAAGALGVRL